MIKQRDTFTTGCFYGNQVTKWPDDLCKETLMYLNIEFQVHDILLNAV